MSDKAKMGRAVIKNLFYYLRSILPEAAATGRSIAYSITPGEVEYRGQDGWMEGYRDGSYKIEITVEKGSPEYQAKQKAYMEKLLRPNG